SHMIEKECALLRKPCSTEVPPSSQTPSQALIGCWHRLVEFHDDLASGDLVGLGMNIHVDLLDCVNTSLVDSDHGNNNLLKRGAAVNELGSSTGLGDAVDRVGDLHLQVTSQAELFGLELSERGIIF